MKKIILFLILFLFVNNACFALENIAVENQVIIDSEWMPTQTQTQDALVHILNYITNIKANTDNLHLIDSSKDILKNISKYRVQFKGLIKGNKQILFCNFFSENYDVDYWEDSIVYVFDGGFWFWQIEYDLQTGKCLDFSVNGGA